MTLTIQDTAPGVPAETMLDVINELRNAGAEAMEIRGGPSGVRVGVDTWVVGSPGALVVDGQPSTRRIRFWPLVIRRRWPRR